MLKFDADTTRILDDAYLGSDIARRRRASFDALAPEPGEVILDLGCGNGLLTADLARAVGPRGKVIGIDPSADMRASAKKACTAFKNVELIDGSCTDLPLPDANADKAVALQVFEYITDLQTACQEAMRVLRPGGRLVIADMHYDHFSLRSADDERMERMMQSWEAHFVWRDAPAQLPGILSKMGYVIEAVKPVNFTDHLLKPDGLANMMLLLMHRYAIDNGHMHADVADAWLAEQHALARAGQFFFSMTHFVVIARKA